MGVNSKIVLSVLADQDNPLDLTTGHSLHQLERILRLASGTGAGKADMVFSDRRTINASSNDDLDLAGVLAGAFGTTLTFARIKAIAIAADANNINNVVIGNAAANQFIGPFGAAAHTEAVRPGGLHLSVATDATAWPVTAGTGDILRLANSGAGSAVTFDIVLLGASA